VRRGGTRVWICGTAAVRSVLSHSPQCNAPNPVYTLFNRTTLHMNHSRSYAHTHSTRRIATKRYGTRGGTIQFTAMDRKKQKRKGPTKFGGTWKAVNYIWTRSLLCAWIMYASFSRISRHRSCIYMCVPQVCIVACSAPPARGGVGESSAKDIWRQRQSWAPASLPIPIRIEFRGTKAIKAATFFP
jgi:hypothetical protein